MKYDSNEVEWESKRERKMFYITTVVSSMELYVPAGSLHGNYLSAEKKFLPFIYIFAAYKVADVF